MHDQKNLGLKPALLALTLALMSGDLHARTAARAAPRPQPVAAAAAAARTPGYNAQRNAYFGDLHVHTKFSFDAYIFNVRATPDDAYRYARGESIRHASGYDVRLADKPLDFLAVTDHSEYLGIVPAMNDPANPLSTVPYAKDLFGTDVATITRAFQRVAASIAEGRSLPELFEPSTSRAAWSEIKAAAERNNQPGRLTTFIGYEFTSAPGGRNLHRNVIFRNAQAPDQPYTAFDSGQDPENLWRWMDALRLRGIDTLAIPHNMNGSDGTMFERTMWDGKPIDSAYADLRARNEPIAEMTQTKGTSDTHPLLSPNDEWANFEIMSTYIGSETPITKFTGGYVRDALKTGLETQATQGFNPYHFGLIGASDTHNAAGSFDEKNFFGKVGVMDGTAQRRGSVPAPGRADWAGFEPSPATARYSSWGAAGLAGVWAEENTREAIFAALRRKETFATSGPRIRVRFFAGYDFPRALINNPDLVRAAYTRGVPMGGDLLARGRRTPQFIVWAMRDPDSGRLQRVQVIKGWIEDGKTREQVFDAACSDGLRPDARTHLCADNGATVNLADCSVSADKGAAELRTMWRDPTFNARQHAFYYVRVLENPSCRWSTWDALRARVPPRPDLQKTIQERAWSSPIWFAPTA